MIEKLLRIFADGKNWRRKMADFANHRRFTLRCLAEGLIPVSIRLKLNIKTPRGLQIIRKAERALLNERIRSINNTLNVLKSQKDTCMKELERSINEEWMAECKTFIEVRREKHHLKTLRRVLYKKQEKEGRRTCLHGIHNDHHSNPTRQNNCCIQIGGENINSSDQANKPRREDEIPEIKENTWVKNLSTSTLTKDQIKALAHGPNYAIVPQCPPTGEYIIAIENVCNQLQQGKAEELRGEIKSVLKNIQPPRPNITCEERKAIEELRRDNTKMILTVDKGVSMVVMNRDDYHQKAEALLQESAYRTITSDPTNKYKNKLIGLLKSIKAGGGINETTYKKLYPTGAGSPKFYGLPKLHKEGTPLRPIVSSIGAVTYSTSKELSRILKPLVGKSPHHICNNHDFLEDLKTIKLGPEEAMVSYDVKALFTSVPIKPALEIIEKLLKEDQDLQKRTSMSIPNVMDLLEFCLRSTYFTYRGKFYEQVEGAAMGSPISPIVANLFMEQFEIRALQSSSNPLYCGRGLLMTHL